MDRRRRLGCVVQWAGCVASGAAAADEFSGVVLISRGDDTLFGSVASVEPGRRRSARAEEAGRVRRPRAARPHVGRSAFAGFRFPAEVITVAVRWYLRYGLSYRDLEELLAERGIEVDHVPVFRWVQRFTPLFADAARPCRPGPQAPDGSNESNSHGFGTID